MKKLKDVTMTILWIIFYAITWVLSAAFVILAAALPFAVVTAVVIITAKFILNFP